METEEDLHGDCDPPSINTVSSFEQSRVSGMSGIDYLLSAHLSAQEQYGHLNQQSIRKQKTMSPLASEVTLSTAIHSTSKRHFHTRKVHILLLATLSPTNLYYL